MKKCLFLESFKFSLFTFGPFCPPPSPCTRDPCLLLDNVNNEKAVSGRGGGAAQQKQSLKQAVLVGDTGPAWYHGWNKAGSVRGPDGQGTAVQPQEGETGSLS